MTDALTHRQIDRQRALRRALAAAFATLVCGLTLAAPEVVVGVEKPGEAFVVDARFALIVPLRTAWEVLTDYDHMSTILSNLATSQITQRSGNTLFVTQEGNARYGLFSYPFTSDREIRLEPMQRIVATQLKGTAKRFTSTTELDHAGNITRLHYHAEIVPGSGIGRIFGGPFIEHEVEEQLHALADEMQRRSGP